MEETKVTAVEVVDIQFRPGQKVYYFDPNGIACKAGDHVIIDTARGAEFGIVAAGNHTISTKEIVSPLRPVLRKTTEQDEKIVEENLQTERKAHQVCLKKIAEYGLDMQLVSAECSFDGSKILFFFTADERVDFRELVKTLATTFHTRIELRQIGVRDKAKMVGGLGICGRPFCCASFLDDFQPVSIKMAKTQNLSLNPVKISGTCGRLMCCLKYEQDAYEDLIRTAPKVESFVDTPEGRGTVVDIDLLRQRAKVRLENQPENIVTYRNEEIAIFRNGKPKKNDPPIPEDWAPISGNGKKEVRQEREAPVFLDPIKYMEAEQVEQEAPVQEEKAQEKSEERSNRHRRNRNRHHRAEKKNAPEAPKTEAPKAETQNGEEKKNNGHRRYRHHRNRKPNQGKQES